MPYAIHLSFYLAIVAGILIHHLLYICNKSSYSNLAFPKSIICLFFITNRHWCDLDCWSSYSKWYEHVSCKQNNIFLSFYICHIHNNTNSVGYAREHECGKTTTKQTQTTSYKQINNPGKQQTKQTDNLIPALALFMSGGVSTNYTCPYLLSFKVEVNSLNSPCPYTLYSSGNINHVSTPNR